jgi:Fur family peroxide stress response transcriptional regulator
MLSKSERLISSLRQSGLRVTPQRRAICRYLSETDAHPTAAMIYDALKPEMPSLSLMTVYNTLNALVDVGAIHAIGQAGDDTIHYDPDTTPHINLVCISCQKITDLKSTHFQHLRQDIEGRSGFKIQNEQVLFFGICPDCRES